MVHSCRACVSGATLATLVGCSAPSSPPADMGATLQAVESSISRTSLERYASAIVHYERPSGSDGENAAIDSVVAALDEAGVPVTVHSFDTYASDPVAAVVSAPGIGTLDAITMAYSGSAEGLTAPLVDLGRLSDLPGLEVGTDQRLALAGDADLGRDPRTDLPEVRGAIALVEGQPRNVPTAVLALLGASGVVFTNPEERVNDLIVTSTWGTPSLRNYHRLPSIPVVQVTRSAGDALRSRLSEGPIEATISARVNTGRKTLRLAVARIDGPTTDAPFVLLGGHIDGWYHGGTDEGASNAAMVELAKAFHAHRGRLRRGLVVAWWPGHSNARYAGSTWFSDHFFQELTDRAVAYMNIDGVGQVDAKRFSATATASLGPLARAVARDVVAVDSLPVSPPGRNSDQSFNGVGLPLLQFNHTRLSDDGGYWWWHTPDDTFDKIDFDVLMTDTRLYAGALTRLLTDPVLPIDLAGEVEAIGALIAWREDGAAGRFDLGDAAAAQQQLSAAVARVMATAPGHVGPELDRSLLRILRPLYRVGYDPLDPFHPDPGFAWGLLPGLAPVTVLAEEDPGSDRYLFAETTLVRERNRLVEALADANREARTLLTNLEGR